MHVGSGPGNFKKIGLGSVRQESRNTIDIIFPLVDGNQLLDSDAAWGQIALHSAEPITNQTPYCALSDGQ